MYDVVFETCGGVVTEIEQLKDSWQESEDEKRKVVVEKYAIMNIRNAISKSKDYIVRYPEMTDILNEFKT